MFSLVYNNYDIKISKICYYEDATLIYMTEKDVWREYAAGVNMVWGTLVLPILVGAFPKSPTPAVFVLLDMCTLKIQKYGIN